MTVQHHQSFASLSGKNKHWAKVVEFVGAIQLDPQLVGERRAVLERFKDCGDIPSLRAQQEQSAAAKRQARELKIQQLKQKRDRLLEEHQRRQRVHKEQLATKKRRALINYINDQYNQVASSAHAMMRCLPKLFSHPDDVHDEALCLEAKRQMVDGDAGAGPLVQTIGINGVVRIAVDLLRTIQQSHCKADLPAAGQHMIAEFQANFGRPPVTHQQAVLAELEGRRIEFGTVLGNNTKRAPDHQCLLEETRAMAGKCSVSLSVDTNLVRAYQGRIDDFNRGSNEFNDYAKRLLQEADAFDFSHSGPAPMAPLRLPSLDRAYLRMKALEEYCQSLPSVGVEMDSDRDDEADVARVSAALSSLQRQAKTASDYLAKLTTVKQVALYKLDKINTII